MSHGRLSSFPLPRPMLTRSQRGEVEQALGAVAVAEDEERAAAALGLDALAQLGGRGGVGLKWGRHRRTVKATQGDGCPTSGGQV